jgi:DNA-binding SARP family transcriptional activator
LETFNNPSNEPHEASSHQVLAKAYEAVERPAEAIPQWELAAKLDPADASPYYHLYRIYLASSEEDKAQRAYAEFKKLSATY